MKTENSNGEIIIKKTSSVLKLVATFIIVATAIISLVIYFNNQASTVAFLKDRAQVNSEMNIQQDTRLTVLEEYVKSNEKSLAELNKKIDLLVELHLKQSSLSTRR